MQNDKYIVIETYQMTEYYKLGYRFVATIHEGLAHHNNIPGGQIITFEPITRLLVELTPAGEVLRGTNENK